MSLTDTTIRSATATDKPRKLYDTDGLYLLVSPAGSKLWRFKYRYNGVEKLISLGSYPEVKLAEAREKRNDARRLVANGTNPSAQRQEEKAATSNTFESIAREYLGEQSKVLGAATLEKNTWFLDTFLVPHIGSTPIDQVTAPDILRALKAAQARGLTDSVQRTKMLCSRVFRYAGAHGRVKHDPTSLLKGAIVTVAAQHHAAITDPKKVGELLRAIDGYQGQPSAVYGLRLLALTFLRPGELRALEWDWVDLANATIRVPAAVMKMKDEHLVPLSNQAVQSFRELYAITGGGKYCFQSLVPGKYISENTLNGALRRLGYTGEEQTSHGFRTIASTMLNEMGEAPDLIELQMAHKERNAVRAAYNRAQRLQERREMMQRWANHLDGLRGAR